MIQPNTALFTDVDNSHDPDFYVNFLAASNALPAMATVKQLTYGYICTAGTKRVLEVGCGDGEDAYRIAEALGPASDVVGIDVSTTMVDAASKRYRSANLRFKVADAQDLPFADGSFDAAHCERTLMHVPNPSRAIAEIMRILAPGGLLALFDADWDTLILDSVDPRITRLVTEGFANSITTRGMGRQLARLSQEAGFQDVTSQAVLVDVHFDFARLLLGGTTTALQTDGSLTRDEAESWWRSLGELDRAGVFQCCVTCFVVCANKPSEA